MSDDRLLDAEREREIAECKHTTGYDLVCRGCGLPAAAPLEGFAGPERMDETNHRLYTAANRLRDWLGDESDPAYD